MPVRVLSLKNGIDVVSTHAENGATTTRTTSPGKKAAAILLPNIFAPVMPEARDAAGGGRSSIISIEDNDSKDLLRWMSDITIADDLKEEEEEEYVSSVRQRS